MDNYFEIREKLRDMQNELRHKLENILKETGISRDMAWFNFNQDRFVIVWTNGKLSMDILKKLEDNFGEVDYIYSTRLSDYLNIVFKRAGEE